MAEIRINASDWDELTDAQRNHIHQILLEARSLKPGDRIVGHPDAPRAIGLAEEARIFLATRPKQQEVSIGGDIACTAAEIAAVTACNALPPPADIACIAAAHIAAEECRKRS
jgi:hypothetical protein